MYQMSGTRRSLYVFAVHVWVQAQHRGLKLLSGSNLAYGVKILSHFVSPVLDWWMVTCPGCMLLNTCPWMGWKKLRKSLNYWSYLQTPQNHIQWCIFWGGTSSIHTSYNPENPKDQCPHRNIRYNNPESWVRANLAEWQRPSFTVTPIHFHHQ